MQSIEYAEYDIPTDFARKELIHGRIAPDMKRAELRPNLAHHEIEPPAIHGLIRAQKESATRTSSQICTMLWATCAASTALFPCMCSFFSEHDECCDGDERSDGRVAGRAATSSATAASFRERESRRRRQVRTRLFMFWMCLMKLLAAKYNANTIDYS
jgi:hypothetical protein